jgi:hypothetical protein
VSKEQLAEILSEFKQNHYADINVDNKSYGKITLEFNSIPMIELYKSRIPSDLLAKQGFSSLDDKSAIKCFSNTLEMELWMSSHTAFFAA